MVENEDEFYNNLITQIEHAFEHPASHPENQILTQVANLCSLIVKDSREQAFKELEAKQINILPYIVENFQAPQRKNRYDAYQAFEIALEKTPILLDQKLVNQVCDLLIEDLKKDLISSDDIEPWDIRMMFSRYFQKIWDKRRELIPEALQNVIRKDSPNFKGFIKCLYYSIRITSSNYGWTIEVVEKWEKQVWLIWTNQELIDKIIYNCLNPTIVKDELKKRSPHLKKDLIEYEFLRGIKNAILALSYLFMAMPGLLNQERVASLVEICKKQNSEEAKWIAKEIFKNAAEQRPEFISATIPTIYNMFSDPNIEVREIAVYLFKKIIEKSPKNIEKEGIKRIVGLLKGDDDAVRWAAVGTYKAAIHHVPQFVDLEGIRIIVKIATKASPMFRRAAREVSKLFLEKVPNLIPEELKQVITSS